MIHTKYLGLLLAVTLVMVGCNQNTPANVTEGNPSSNAQIEQIENINNAIQETREEVEYFIVTKDTPLENRGLKMEIIGSAVYDKIESEDFTDTPSDTNKYLVLFLSIQNRTGKDEYFNYNNIIAKLDGADITDTFLINNPLKYTSIKTNIPDEMVTQGYLVWEVPEDWEKLEVTYTGWSENLYTEPTIVLTPEDLGEPERYKEDNRII